MEIHSDQNGRPERLMVSLRELGPNDPIDREVVATAAKLLHQDGQHQAADRLYRALDDGLGAG